MQLTERQLYVVLHRSAVAARVLVRLGSFRVGGLGDLERAASRLPWHEVVPDGRGVDVHASTSGEQLQHTGAVAERVARCAGGLDPDGQRIVVRAVGPEVTISADASGEHLHRRGWRLAGVKAPLRENLAAAMLRVAGWTGDEPLVDPFCGSGTIPIEAARLARRIAPGADRDVAMAAWPTFQPGTWGSVVGAARAEELPVAGVTLVGSDRDAGAIQAASANAERARVVDDVDLMVRAISDAQAPDGPSGWVVTNPPFGKRVGEGDLRPLYQRIGSVLRERFPGWGLAILDSDPRLAGQIGLPLDEAWRVDAGGLRVRCSIARIPEGS